MRALLLLTVLAIAVPVRPDIAPKQERPPENPLLGHWQMMRVSFGDTVLPEEAQGSSITFTPTEIHAIKKGKRSPGEDATYSVDWSKKPAAIDLTPKTGDKVEGILKIEGDLLTICFSINPKGPRPADFAVRPDAATGMLELKRMTK